MEAHDCGPKYLSKGVESMATQRHAPRCLFQFCSLYSFLAPNKSNALASEWVHTLWDIQMLEYYSTVKEMTYKVIKTHRGILYMYY